MTTRSIVLLLTAILLTATNLPAQDYGTITGQFVLDGDVPPPKILVKKGDPSAKDAACCAQDNVVSDELVIDPTSKGIANIFVYLDSRIAARLPIHPDLKESKEKEVVFDQVGCRFVPHAMIIRTDQTLVVKSADNCSHNTNAQFISNQGFNFISKANDREGQKVDTLNRAERLPMTIQCNIHPWMSAKWLVIDHPYAVITDTDGKFKLENVPAGEHEFFVNHELAGYIAEGYPTSHRRGFTVTVEPGQTADIGVVKVPLENFQK